jgi:hypothetical protein
MKDSWVLDASLDAYGHKMDVGYKHEKVLLFRSLKKIKIFPLSVWIHGSSINEYEYETTPLPIWFKSPRPYHNVPL